MGFSFRGLDPTKHFKDSMDNLKNPPAIDDWEAHRNNAARIFTPLDPVAAAGYGDYQAQGAMRVAREKARKKAELEAIREANRFDRDSNRANAQPFRPPQTGGMMMPGTEAFNAYRDRAGLNNQVGAVSNNAAYLASRTPTRTDFAPLSGPTAFDNRMARDAQESLAARTQAYEQQKQNAINYYDSIGHETNGSPLMARLITPRGNSAPPAPKAAPAPMYGPGAPTGGMMAPAGGRK